jgi:hypothetical protein
VKLTAQRLRLPTTDVTQHQMTGKGVLHRMRRYGVSMAIRSRLVHSLAVADQPQPTQVQQPPSMGLTAIAATRSARMVSNGAPDYGHRQVLCVNAVCSALARAWRKSNCTCRDQHVTADLATGFASSAACRQTKRRSIALQALPSAL